MKLLSKHVKVFISKTHKNLLQCYQIKQHLCIPFNPRGNSILKRSHSNILDGLRSLSHAKMKYGILIIDSAHNATVSTATGASPIQLEFGRKKFLTAPIEDIKQFLQHSKTTKDNKSNRYLEKVNKNRSNFDFKNKKVFIKRQRFSKLEPLFDNPFDVIEDNPNQNFVKVKIKNKIQCFPYRAIKPFKDRESVLT